MKSKRAALELDTIGKWILGLILLVLLLMLGFAIKNKIMGGESSLLSNIFESFRRGLR